MNSSYPNASTETMSQVVRESAGRSAFRFNNRREHSGEPARTASVTPVASPGKTRPRGRLLIAILMIIACGSGAFTVWDSLFRYQAYGVGECIKPNEPLFSMIEESSLEVEVFLPQQLSDTYKVGDTIRLRIEPFDELVPCEVISIAAEHRRPPENIEVFYRSHVRLLPIRVKPLGEFSSDRKLSVGSVAQLPPFGNLF